MKMALQVQNINLQEGYLISDNLQPIAAFNHSKKILIWKEGWGRHNCELPANYEDYEDTVTAGHFNVNFFDMSSYNNLNTTDVETEGRPHLIEQAKRWVRDGNPSDKYIQSQMYAERDQNTGIRHIVLAIRDARKELGIPQQDED